jgi:flavin-binding protein dodecin
VLRTNGTIDSRPGKETCMSDRTYRVTELVGTSKDGVEAAIRAAIARAGHTLRHVDWFEVTEIRGYIRDNEVDSYQVGVKLGFRLEDP